MPSRRFDRRQGFLISATLHMVILTLLANAPERTAVQEVAATPAPEATPPPRRVMLLRPGVLERMLRPLPPQAEPREAARAERDPLVALPPAVPVMPAPTPQPSPPAARAKDRASIGTHADERRQLKLRADQDLASRRGRPGDPGPLNTPPPPGAGQSSAGTDALTAAEAPRTTRGGKSDGPVAGPEVAGRGLEPHARPAGGGRGGDRSDPGQRSAAGPDQQRSITRSLEELDRRLGQMGDMGGTGGAGIQMGSIFFDPEGADFTGWINHFKNEAYRNWIVPEAVRLGFRAGHVDFEFWVERDGRMTGLRLLKSSGTAALDRAAQHALTGSRLLALPSDYGPERLQMQVSFYYNEAAQG
jgi:TonB family protein